MAESALIEEKERVLKAEKTIEEAKNATKKAKKIAVELQEKLTSIETRAQKAASQVVAEFRESKEYEDELADVGTDVFQLSFQECKKQVHHLMPKVDLSYLQLDKESDESGDEDVEAEEDHPHPSS